jgi:hypothetical protein
MYEKVHANEENAHEDAEKDAQTWQVLTNRR